MCGNLKSHGPEQNVSFSEIGMMMYLIAKLKIISANKQSRKCIYIFFPLEFF